MRPLVLAAILFALAGCSVNYQGTSFKAVPKFEASKEGEGHESEQGAEAPAADGPRVKTGTAFPPTAQPSGKPAASGE